MILTAIGSLLGGAAFRAVWGEASAFLRDWQSHKFELQRMEAQEKLDAAQHARNLESIRAQHDMGVEVIRVQSSVDLAKLDAQTFLKGVELTGAKTGNWLIDGWNAAIRPLIATEALLLWTVDIAHRGWLMNENDLQIVFAAIGLYLADRALAKRGR